LRSEHVITVRDETKGRLVVVMNLAESSLAPLQPLPRDETEARDTKPGNVLFEGGFWKVSDFGVSKRAAPQGEGSPTLGSCRDA